MTEETVQLVAPLPGDPARAASLLDWIETVEDSFDCLHLDRDASTLRIASDAMSEAAWRETIVEIAAMIGGVGPTLMESVEAGRVAGRPPETIEIRLGGPAAPEWTPCVPSIVTTRMRAAFARR